MKLVNVDLLKVDFSKYESPIAKIVRDMQTKMIEQEENQLMMEVEQAVGFAVNREELLKALQYDRDQFAKGYEAGLNADKWISVKDQLPEREGEYLVTRNGRIEIDSYYKNRKREGCRFNGERWEDYEEIGDMWISGGGIIWENPEAWMELPEIYHEKEGDEE